LRDLKTQIIDLEKEQERQQNAFDVEILKYQSMLADFNMPSNARTSREKLNHTFGNQLDKADEELEPEASNMTADLDAKLKEIENKNDQLLAINHDLIKDVERLENEIASLKEVNHKLD